ncbi:MULTISPECIES: flagellar protein FlgN [Niallia]|uniref:flagellar protein FlgN n=1 Tax=Niallia TaxID=2837506 RepID=UPI00148F742D|nr:flagellar protein FlgN [Niallia circulans]NRG27620.1 flagellar protein FlgN [Niallia circulans]QJX63806.1 flagellar protein FlgN [Niallia circulans]
MSAPLLMQTLDKLVRLHQSLHEVAKEKTEAIKVGDMDALKQVMKDEQAHIMSIQKLEEARMTISKRMVPVIPNPTVMDCVKYLDSQDAENLTEIANHLKEIIMDLSETNSLNQQLLQQSMQFVNVSLNLLKPTQKSINYGKPSGNNIQTNAIGRQGNSLLNIKA